MHENSGKDDITLVQRSVLAMDIRAKICTKIEAKTTVHWYTNKLFNERYTGENMHENWGKDDITLVHK